VAQFYPRKKIPLLIRAFSGVVREFSGIKLVLAGDGFEMNRCRTLSQKLHVENNIIFTGLIQDRNRIASLFKHCLVFCHSSHQEAFGNVIIEAMASTKPVVAINASAVPEIIRHNENGILVPPDDEHQLRNALIELIKNPGLRDSLAVNARKTAEQYSIHTMINDYIRVFNKRLKKFIQKNNR
jgi:glycosyltransferase involved in cell wall biosynthesis